MSWKIIPKLEFTNMIYIYSKFKKKKNYGFRKIMFLVRKVQGSEYPTQNF
jgi:hypothetical protein